MFRTAPRLSAVTATIVAATVIAACGSTSSAPPSASSSGGHPSQAQMRQDAVRFAACMRSRGVDHWPDPTSSGLFDKSKLTPQLLGVGDAELRADSRACGYLLPAAGAPGPGSAAKSRTQVGAMLAFARCLRSHGFPRFPDPTSSGEVTHEMLASAGINIHQPAALQAADGCVGVTHGMISEASVARFVAGQ